MPEGCLYEGGGRRRTMSLMQTCEEGLTKLEKVP